MIFLRQSTQIKVRIGPFVDVSDGFTPETGVTLSGADEAELLKEDGAATVDISGATWAAVTGADGWYDLTLTTTHTNTVGELIVVVQDDSVCLPVYQKFQVVEEAIYDALFAASANVFEGAAGSNAVRLVTTTTTNTDMRGTDSAYTGTPPTAVSIRTEMDSNSTQLAAIKAVTDALTAAAAAKLATSAGTMVTGTVDTATNGHTPTTSEFQADDITEATADHYNGRTIIFASGALQYQACTITDYQAVGGIAQFTTSTLTEAPSSGDTFILV